MAESQVVIAKKLKRAILAMVAEDQKMYKSGKPDMNIARQHTEKIKRAIERFGWPGKSLVGERAAMGAWLIVQHSDHDLKFQRWALKSLERAVEKREAEKAHAAYLTDRVLVNAGRPQLFGTQFYFDSEGNLKPRPIKSKRSLNQRRKRYHLESFAKYARAMKKQYIKVPH